MRERRNLEETEFCKKWKKTSELPPIFENYAHKMRNGDETAEYTKENPRGRWNNPSGIGKYGTPPKPPTGDE